MTTKMTELRMRMRRERLGTRILTRVLSFTPRLDARYSTPGTFNGLEAAGLTTPGEGDRYFFFGWIQLTLIPEPHLCRFDVDVVVLLPGKILITFKVNLNVLLKPFPIHNMTTSGLVAELKKYNKKPK